MTLSAVLLVGGESTRMGTDKATLPWRGRPMWEWQLDKLRALRPDRLMVSARSQLPWRPSDAALVLDSAPSRGPLSGLAAACAASRSDHLLVLAVDMPLMTVEHLRALYDCARKSTGVIPVIDRRVEPLTAIYSANAGPFFEEALRTDNFSLQSVAKKLVDIALLKEFRVPLSARDFYSNINAPGELAELEPQRSDQSDAVK